MRRTVNSVFAIALFCLTGAACAGEVARMWLDRMHDALDQLTYVGTFVTVTGGKAETLQVTHRYENEVLHERIFTLDGAEREIIRRDNDLRVIYPDQRVVMYEKVVASNPMVAALPSYSGKLEPYYELREFDTDRVAGRKVQVISISPRDEYRYGYLLWLDWETAMPLRSRCWNDQEEIIEEILFTDINYPEFVPDSEFEQKVDSSGFTELRSSEPQYELNHEKPWTVEGLPEGFELMAAMLKSIADSLQLVEHLVYSDGLATVSVFIDRQDAVTDLATGFYRVGSTNAYSLTKDGQKITAIGEVPPRTLEAIATSLRAQRD